MKKLSESNRELISMLPKHQQEAARSKVILGLHLKETLESPTMWKWYDHFIELVKASSELGLVIDPNDLKKILDLRQPLKDKDYTNKQQRKKFSKPKRYMNFEETKAWFLDMVVNVAYDSKDATAFLKGDTSKGKSRIIEQLLNDNEDFLAKLGKDFKLTMVMPPDWKDRRPKVQVTPKKPTPKPRKPVVTEKVKVTEKAKKLTPKPASKPLTKKELAQAYMYNLAKDLKASDDPWDLLKTVDYSAVGQGAFFAIVRRLYDNDPDLGPMLGGSFSMAAFKKIRKECDAKKS